MTIKCPCCESDLRHEYTEHTHMFFCTECPIIMFEFYDKKNLEDLKRIIYNDRIIN